MVLSFSFQYLDQISFTLIRYTLRVYQKAYISMHLLEQLVPDFVDLIVLALTSEARQMPFFQFTIWLHFASQPADPNS